MSGVMEFMDHSQLQCLYNVVAEAFEREGDLKQMEYLLRLLQSERIKQRCVHLCHFIRIYDI